MKRVQRALGRDEPAWALALLQQLDEQVPGGRLLEERAAGRAIANCSIDPTSGQEELRRFSSGYPRSVHLSRVTQVCTPGGGKSDPR